MQFQVWIGFIILITAQDITSLKESCQVIDSLKSELGKSFPDVCHLILERLDIIFADFLNKIDLKLMKKFEPKLQAHLKSCFKKNFDMIKPEIKKFKDSIKYNIDFIFENSQSYIANPPNGKMTDISKLQAIRNIFDVDYLCSPTSPMNNYKRIINTKQKDINNINITFYYLDSCEKLASETIIFCLDQIDDGLCPSVDSELLIPGSIFSSNIVFTRRLREGVSKDIKIFVEKILDIFETLFKCWESIHAELNELKGINAIQKYFDD